MKSREFKQFAHGYSAKWRNLHSHSGVTRFGELDSPAQVAVA